MIKQYTPEKVKELALSQIRLLQNLYKEGVDKGYDTRSLHLLLLDMADLENTFEKACMNLELSDLKQEVMKDA